MYDADVCMLYSQWGINDVDAYVHGHGFVRRMDGGKTVQEQMCMHATDFVLARR